MAWRAPAVKLPSISLSSVLTARFAAVAPRALTLRRASPLHHRLRPLLALAAGLRCFSTRPAASSLNDPSPNWSSRPPKETILLDGCDFEHWLVVMEEPEPSWSRDQIIDSYIKTLATVVGSEEEARLKIYSVSTKHYFAFGALVSEELSYKIKTLPKVRWVLPDSYLDVKNKDYGGEPFINGQAVPYDAKYHEEWVRNNARANERSRRNDRPRNYDRSRNFERRRGNVQNFQNRDAPSMPNQNLQDVTPSRDEPLMPGNSAQNAMPPVSNQGFNAMPLRGNSINSDPLGAGYQNQMPNPQTVVTNSEGNMPSGPVYQGNTQGFQGGNLGGQVHQQGSNFGYPQGAHTAYEHGPPPPYQQGSDSSYQQGPPPPTY